MPDSVDTGERLHDTSAMPATELPRKLLILDLDETLIYADETPLSRPPDAESGPYAVYLRPGLADFVDTVFEHFDVAVWTSSNALYADSVCRIVFGERAAALRFVWSRDRCTSTRDFENDTWTHAKRLKKVRRIGYDLDWVLVVDDSPEKQARNYGNLVQVLPFVGDPADDELPRLASYLLSLRDAINVRAVENRFWRARVDD